MCEIHKNNFLQNTSDGCFWLSSTTINISAKATFQQNMVDCSINWLYWKLFHQENFRFRFEEVQIDIEQVLSLTNSNQKLTIDTER